MKKNNQSHLIILCGCMFLSLNACSKNATEAQINETNCAIEQEQMLENRFESEIIKNVQNLSEEAKKMEYYYINDDGEVWVLFSKVMELESYQNLKNLHDKYHYKFDNERQFLIFYSKFYKWNIVDGKIKKIMDESTGEKTDGKIINSTLCPFCLYLLTTSNKDFSEYSSIEEIKPSLTYIFRLKESFRNLKLFGYYMNHPDQIIGI